MGRLPVCLQIKCPYFCDDCKTSYGCQAYPNSCGCHLKAIYGFESNEYALFASSQIDVTALKAENNRFFKEDPKYADDVKFQQDFPELFEEGRFKVGILDS